MENSEIQKPSRRYNVFQAVVLSFFSKALYQDVGRCWKGIGFLYLLLLLAIVWVPRAARVHLWVAPEIAKHAPVIFKSMPAFKIEKGLLSVDVKQPYVIRDKEKISVIIDTTGQYTSLDQVPKEQEDDNFMLILKDKALIRKHRFGDYYEDNTFVFSMIRSLDINKEKMITWSNLLAGWAGLLVYPFAVFGYFIFTISTIMIYALMGLGIAKILGSKLKYEASLRLAAVSHTPAILLATVFFVSEIKVPWWFFVFFALSTVYLFLAVKFCMTAPPAVPEPPVAAQ